MTSRRILFLRSLRRLTQKRAEDYGNQRKKLMLFSSAVNHEMIHTPSKISIVKGDSRKENIKDALRLIGSDIEKSIRGKKSGQLFIKINAIDTNFPIACTSIDAIEAVLSVFYDRFDEIIVGDNSFVFTKNKGGPYRKILDNFPKARLSDLTEFSSESIEFMGLDGKTTAGRISLLPKEAFTISLALPKTHDTFVYTGCLKNMFGCVIKNRKSLHAISFREGFLIGKFVRSNKLKWNNLVDVINRTKPDLCVLDAYEGMEGDGPLFGDNIKVGVAMCSQDGLALDRLASEICGFGYIPYLSLLSAGDKGGNKEDNSQGMGSKDIEIVKMGFDDITGITKKFRPHYNSKYQIMTSLNSWIPRVDFWLAFSILRRSYRLRDRMIDRLKDKGGDKNAVS